MKSSRLESRHHQDIVATFKDVTVEIMGTLVILSKDSIDSQTLPTEWNVGKFNPLIRKERAKGDNVPVSMTSGECWNL